MISVPYHSHIFGDSYGNSAFLRYTSKVSGVDPSKVFLPNTSLRKMFEFGIYPTQKKNKIDTQNGHSLKGDTFSKPSFLVSMIIYVKFLGKVNLPIHPCG